MWVVGVRVVGVFVVGVRVLGVWVLGLWVAGVWVVGVSFGQQCNSSNLTLCSDCHRGCEFPKRQLGVWVVGVRMWQLGK